MIFIKTVVFFRLKTILLILPCLIVFELGISIADSPGWHEYARLVGNYTDYGIDVDRDGYPDILTINVGINVTSSGEYSLLGYLYDAMNKEVAWSIDHRNLSYGPSQMILNFNFRDIRKNSSEGHFYLKNVLLAFGYSPFFPHGHIISTDWTYQACNTSTYKIKNTTIQSLKDYAISGSGKGEVLLSVSISKSLSAISGSYSLDLLGLHIPPFSSDFKVSTKNLSGYAYESEGIYMPGMPNNFSVSASGVKNLNIGLKKQQGSYENTSNVWTDKYTRIWISSQSIANDKNVAKLESYLISPGIYQAKIFGDAAENASQVNLTMTLVKKVIVNGRFNLSINATGFPSGDYSITAKALNGTFKLDELEIGDIIDT